MGFGQFLRSITDPVGSYRRQVAGTPKGGQFAPGYHAEVHLDLTLNEQALNAEGTWEHPTMPRTAAALVDFWMNVPVPDYVTDHVLRNAKDVNVPAIARTIARCEMMRRDMARLPDSEKGKAFRHPISFPNGAVFNAHDALKFYGCDMSPNLLPSGPY